MGLAASQARLLSITSRMADNELRSQLINNAKMRLTTDSSNASAKYLDALSETQLMFSNYSTSGDSQYQQLNFNNLTAYSAYNNQYGLSNRGGELLVSESDAKKFENSDSLEEFLESYGLEKTTTYFENEDIFAYIDENIQDIYEGDMIYEYTENDDGSVSSVLLSGIHYGYEESLNSKDYGIYTTLLSTYTAAKDTWESVSLQSRKSYINTLTASDGSDYSSTYQEVISWYNTLYYDYDDDGNFVGFYSEVDDSGDPVYLDTNTVIEQAKTYQELMLEYYTQVYSGGHYLATVSSVDTAAGNGNDDYEDETSAFHYKMQYYLDMLDQDTTISSMSQAYVRTGYTPSLTGVDEDSDGTIDYYYYQISEDDADEYEKTSEQLMNDDVPVYEVVIREVEVEVDTYVDSIHDMYTFFQKNILNALDEGTFRAEYIADSDEDAITAAAKFDKAQEDYYTAAEQLSYFIFGEDVGEDYYEYLDDMEWILYGDYIDDTYPSLGRTGAPLFSTTALNDSEGGVVYYMDDEVAGCLTSEDLPYQANFQVVIDVYLSELMMEEYGTPSYTWIDTNNRNEDGEAKAEWYTNLYSRMLEGYESISDSLASSSEWLQFALESGLVTMEQVNSSDEWVSLTYTNCTNITESQVDVDITIAEAEYNKTMNEIEAKDQKYDLELKNIDTEHESLQTEYDSIKSVIDKNVERNFKMFDA